MKLAAQVLAVLALVAYATPAFPCPGHEKQHTTAANEARPQPAQPEKQAPAPAKAEKADKEKVAKTQKAKGATAEKGSAAN